MPPIEAERIYRNVSAINPKHVSGLYYLGLLGIQTGRPGLGAEIIAKAIACNDRVPEWQPCFRPIRHSVASMMHNGLTAG
jgi:hypothetical protein